MIPLPSTPRRIALFCHCPHPHSRAGLPYMRTEGSTRLTHLRIIQLQLHRHTRSIVRTTLLAPVTTRTATGPALLPIIAYAVRVCTPCLFPSPKHILSALDCHAIWGVEGRCVSEQSGLANHCIATACVAIWDDFCADWTPRNAIAIYHTDHNHYHCCLDHGRPYYNANYRIDINILLHTHHERHVHFARLQLHHIF